MDDELGGLLIIDDELLDVSLEENEGEVGRIVRSDLERKLSDSHLDSNL